MRLGRRRKRSLQRALGALILVAGFWLVTSALPVWLSRLLVGLAIAAAGWSLIKDGG